MVNTRQKHNSSALWYACTLGCSQPTLFAMHTRINAKLQMSLSLLKIRQESRSFLKVCILHNESVKILMKYY